MAKRDTRSLLWLLLGIALLTLAHMRFGVGVLAWFAPAPFLHYLRLRPGFRARLVFFAASLFAWNLVVLKIVSAPMPWVIALGYGLPLGLVLGIPYLGADLLRRRLGEGAGTLSFGALTVLAEWSLHAFLPFGTWGSLVNTQLDHLALLQLSSVTGTHGVSALMAVIGSLLARWLAGERLTLRKSSLAAALTLLGVLAFGQARLAIATSSGHQQRRVAAVGTDSMVGTTPELPDRATLIEVEDGLVARTELAARSGASLVVWNEAATMVWPKEEQAWTLRLQDLASRLKIDLVAAYVVPVSVNPLRYENKYLHLRADGSLHHEYLKHEPVPGEPAVRGTGPMPFVPDSGEGSVSGAICYDYDFPRLGLEHAQLGVDLVTLPSSDWRGIDPIHTLMSRLRAIEGGHSLIRSTRFGLSAGFDPWGQMIGRMSHFDGPSRVLVVDLPAKGVTTFYGQVGDWFPLLCLLFLSAIGSRAWLLRSNRDGFSIVSGDASSDRSLRAPRVGR